MAKNANDSGIDAQLQALLKERDELKAQLEKKSQALINMKIAAKGGLSVYGLGRFPVTLYVEQWERLAAEMPNILQFIEQNRGKLKTKESA